MIAADEDALICDMAEVYKIYDVDSLPLSLYAKLACGLRENSRIKTKMSGLNYPIDTMMLAAIYDNTAWLRWAWMSGEDKDKPKVSMYAILSGETEKPKEGDRYTFETAEDFERELQRLREA